MEMKTQWINKIVFKKKKKRELTWTGNEEIIQNVVQKEKEIFKKTAQVRWPIK